MTPLARKYLAPLLIVLSAVFLPVCGQKKTAPAKPAGQTLDKLALETYIRHLFVWPPEVKVEISDPKPSEVTGLREVTVTGSAQGATAQHQFLITTDGQKIIRGTIYDLRQNPFQAELSKLTTESQPSMGTPGAPVVLVLFTDFQCPYCREEAKTIRANLVSAFPKEVRLYFKDFPLEQIHPWAKQAAIGGRCVFQQHPSAFWLYHDWIFEQQGQITPENLNSKIMEFAKGKDLDALQLNRCLQTRATEAEVDRSVKEGTSLQVDSTPTLFINGRRIAQQMPWPQLKAFIDNELAYQKTAKNAGDQPCCEVKLPSPPAQ